MPDQNYMSYSAEECFGKDSNHHIIKDVLGVPMGSRAEAVKQYKLSISKRKKELKAPNNQNKILYRISKKSGSRCEIKKIKNIRSEASKEHCNDRSNY